MKKRTVGLFLLVLILSACQRKPSTSINVETNAIVNMSALNSEMNITTEPDNFTKEAPNFHSEYAQAIESYRSFLNGETHYTDGETKITIAPNHGGKYTLIDMNDDGIPELLTNVIILQYRDADDSMEASDFSSTIFTYKNGEIVEWYIGGDKSFKLLSNKALLFEYEGLGGYNYTYIELDSQGNYSYYMRALKLPEHEDQGCKYYIYNDWTNSEPIEIATEKEWLDFLEPFLSLQTDIIPWNDYTLDINSQ